MRDDSNVIPLADFARGTRVLGAPPRPFRHCGDCPHKRGCQEADDCMWGDEAAPDLRLRPVPIPDIIA